MTWEGLELHNIVELLEADEGLLPMRIPTRTRESLDPSSRASALNCCGCELRFNLPGAEARVHLKRPLSNLAPPTGLASVWNGPFLADWTQFSQYIGSSESVICVRKPDRLEELRDLAAAESLPFDPALVRILLPYDGQVVLLGAEGETSPAEPRQSPRLRHLAYGSSITHGGSGTGPSEGYAPRLARELGRDLLNFGFAGSARMEAGLADYIANRKDWDIATLELGINVIGEWDVETFRERARRFVSAIAVGRPEAIVYCTDILLCGLDFSGEPKLKAFRSALRGVVEDLSLPNLRYCPGNLLLDSYSGLSADLVHPSGGGMERIAHNWFNFMRSGEGDSSMPPGMPCVEGRWKKRK